MAKKGGAILLVYTDLIDEKYDEEFNAWYDTQHLPQLLELPGVLDAARYVAVKGGPKYLAAYEVESVDTVLGPAWANRPIPPWDKRMSPQVIGKNFTRILGEQIFPTGPIDTGRGWRRRSRSVGCPCPRASTPSGTPGTTASTSPATSRCPA